MSGKIEEKRETGFCSPKWMESTYDSGDRRQHIAIPIQKALNWIDTFLFLYMHDIYIPPVKNKLGNETYECVFIFSSAKSTPGIHKVSRR